jgi:alpha-L-fucosidase
VTRRRTTLSTLCAAAVALCGLGAGAPAQTAGYEPTWASLDARPVPRWYRDAKFGIFIHWGVYSVPAWAPVPRDGKVTGSEPYAEWYWRKLDDKDGATWKFHAETYGETFMYQDFAARFTAELFDPARWADLFARSGARYVVLTSKHHDGFALWPSAQSPLWNAAETGPRRDLAGDLTRAVRERGLKMGFYYSLYEWYHPLYRGDVRAYVEKHMLPQVRDLVTRYQPSILWGDGEWEHPSATWRSAELLAWMLNTAPNRDEVVFNDRWGKETRGAHGGFYTTEYGAVHLGTDQKLSGRRAWEECRGMGTSFGYNRNETAADLLSGSAIVHLLVDVVSKGGNLLLDIGPAADGRIPVEMEDRLLEVGAWLRTNGEAIYGSEPWRERSDGDRVRYTTGNGAVYAIALEWPGPELALKAPRPGASAAVTLLGEAGPLKWRAEGGAMRIETPALSPDHARPAYVFKLTNVE